MDNLEKEVAQENKESVDSSDKYEFITETIKKRPINTRKIAKKVFTTISLAIIFGIVSSITLILVYPKLEERYYPEKDTKEVTLPVDPGEVQEEEIEEFVPPEDEHPDDAVAGDSENQDDKEKNASDNHDTSVGENQGEKVADDKAEGAENQNSQTDTKPETADSEGNFEGESESEGSGSGEKPVVINQVVETIEKNLEIEDYRSLLRKIYSIANSAQKSLVTVSGKTSDTDWFNNAYENNNSSTGLIVADNGKDLLIVSPTEILHNASNVDVTFMNGEVVPASVIKSDSNTGLSIVAVALADIGENTLNLIEKAQFGGVTATSVGAPVIAVGAPYGVAGSSAIGQLTSVSTRIDKQDTNIRIISTDIYGSTSATGVLVNYSGRIIGIICHENEFSDMPNLLHAYSVSDITDTIEKMSNNQNLACLGIIGTDVTTEANELYSVPLGAYVKEVVVDSPAMGVGIRNGDVIVKMGTREITCFDDYKAAILSCQPKDTIVITLQRPGGLNEYSEITYEVTLEEQK